MEQKVAQKSPFSREGNSRNEKNAFSFYASAMVERFS
jgi:hypothetical protein